ncbi:class I SAM-dependent methyltransferase [Streptococcus sp. NLN76]|uniref:class I SAM-dependent rRNA methyltransferase n=1 Tax=Streptococcus sp. NLN76 TaxID=2822800 RepID=UPI0018ABA2ED|nr:class I SAM-dependent methyltransferase [Streptococcus sp. NLN76]MBF8970623.1 class I SAM-dependent methyltransferase [Streptococcus sp. NLN76]
MKHVVLSTRCQQEIARGRILLKDKDFQNKPLNDGFVHFQNAKGQFVAAGYLSKQNKGLGWVLSLEPIEWSNSFLVNCFQLARDKRQAYFKDPETTAFRLFNQEGDGLPGLTIDVYGDFLLFTWYNSFIYQNRDQIVASIQKVCPDYLGAYEKLRFQGAPYETGHLYGQSAPDVFTILENGVSYQVFLNDGWMTGIFLDQHVVRRDLVKGMAEGKRLLNLFSYTAAFSIAAIAGGAIETVSVDLAKRSRELSQTHFMANGFSLEGHSLIVMDTFEYLRYAARKNLQFDIIVIDPPSFARNKKQVFSVAKDYHRLVAKALKVLAPKGQMVLSTNAAQLSLEKFKQEIAAGMSGKAYQIEKVYRLPEDFPSYAQETTSNYLKVIKIRVEE